MDDIVFSVTLNSDEPPDVIPEEIAEDIAEYLAFKRKGGKAKNPGPPKGPGTGKKDALPALPTPGGQKQRNRSDQTKAPLYPLA